MADAFHLPRADEAYQSLAREAAPTIGTAANITLKREPILHTPPVGYSLADPDVVPLPNRDTWHQRSWRHDFYYRIWVIPSYVDLGSIPTDVTYTLIVWNAWFHSVQLDSVQVNGDPNSSVSGQSVGDYTLPLAEAPWTLLVGASGPPTVTGQVVWDFDGEVVTFDFKGVRAVVWKFRHNWEQPWEEKIEFKTSVWRAWKGRESRRALRRYPRRTITQAVLAPPEKHYELSTALIRQLDRTFVFPDWPRQTKTTAAAAAGDSSITVQSPLPRWFTADITIFLRAPDSQEEESYRVKSISGSTATVEPALVRDYGEGTKVWYGASGQLPKKGAKTTHHTALATVGLLPFRCEPGSDLRTEYSSPEWNGLPLFDIQPNWATQPSGEWMSQRLEADFGLGRRNWINPIDWHDFILRFRYSEIGRQKALDIIDFFRNRRGQNLPFWAPSWLADLPPIFPISSGTSAFKVAGQDFGKAYRDSPIHKAIRFRLRDGTVIYRKVTSVTLVSDADGDNTLLSVDLPFSQDIAPEDVVYISWVYFARFAQDSLTVKWLTDEVADMTLSVFPLQEEPL